MAFGPCGDFHPEINMDMDNFERSGTRYVGWFIGYFLFFGTWSACVFGETDHFLIMATCGGILGVLTLHNFIHKRSEIFRYIGVSVFMAVVVGLIPHGFGPVWMIAATVVGFLIGLFLCWKCPE